jgi:inner membrane protein
MPSPIAHIAAGAAIYRLRFGRGLTTNRDRLLMVSCVGLSLLPDLDAAVGIIAGDIGRFHNNFAGSPAFGTLVALAAGALTWLVRRHLARSVTILVFISYQVHVLMDFLTISRGSMLLWPFSTERISPPLHVFYGFRWSHGLVSELHLITLVTELIFAGALVGMVMLVDRRRQAPASDLDSR